MPVGETFVHGFGTCNGRAGNKQRLLLLTAECQRFRCSVAEVGMHSNSWDVGVLSFERGQRRGYHDITVMGGFHATLGTRSAPHR